MLPTGPYSLSRFSTCDEDYLTSAIRRHISARSSVVMEPHNSLITSENLSDD